MLWISEVPVAPPVGSLACRCMSNDLERSSNSANPPIFPRLVRWSRHTALGDCIYWRQEVMRLLRMVFFSLGIDRIPLHTNRSLQWGRRLCCIIRMYAVGARASIDAAVILRKHGSARPDFSMVDASQFGVEESLTGAPLRTRAGGTVDI
jgi:hypothetical protein